jgi:Fic family protein
VSFLAIHPFQDGNGRLSRVLTTLPLLRSGYAPPLMLELAYQTGHSLDEMAEITGASLGNVKNKCSGRARCCAGT